LASILLFESLKYCVPRIELAYWGSEEAFIAAIRAGCGEDDGYPLLFNELHRFLFAVTVCDT
jgi:hypothetical protein